MLRFLKNVISTGNNCVKSILTNYANKAAPYTFQQAENVVKSSNVTNRNAIQNLFKPFKQIQNVPTNRSYCTKETSSAPNSDLRSLYKAFPNLFNEPEAIRNDFNNSQLPVLYVCRRLCYQKPKVKYCKPPIQTKTFNEDLDYTAVVARAVEVPSSLLVKVPSKKPLAPKRFRPLGTFQGKDGYTGQFNTFDREKYLTEMRKHLMWGNHY